MPQDGIPSEVCRITARRKGPEVTVFVLDRSNSMNYLLLVRLPLPLLSHPGERAR